MLLLQLSACLAILITGGIVVSVAAESYRFFTLIPVNDFLFGMEWSPQIAIREDQAGASGSFGLVPVMAGTFFDYRHRHAFCRADRIGVSRLSFRVCGR